MNATRARAIAGAVACAVACAACLALPAARVFGEPVEPPPDAPADADYEIERADTLASGDVEVGVGYAASDGGRVQSRRRVAFHSDSLDGSAREGAGDALSGATLEGAVAGGWFGVGRSLPRWGRGLAIGDPREPWSARTPVRGRSKQELVGYRRQAPFGLSAWCGAPAGRRLAGLAIGRPPAGAGLVADRAGLARASVWGSRGPPGATVGGELAIDRRGRWRAEAGLDRDGRGRRLSALVRAGAAGYHGVGDPRRSGPASALGVRAERGAGRRARVTALGALWRFVPGVSGVRGMLEVEQPLAQHARVVVGFEEQHGTRRDPVQAGGPVARPEFREGTWLEWRAASGPLLLAWRNERWGSQPWARAAVRTLNTGRAGIESHGGLGVRVTHTVFRADRGEHVYLPELESDRLVLRALSGDGERTRLEIKCPFAGGHVLASVDRGVTASRPPRLQWTLEWTRRARFARGP